MNEQFVVFYISKTRQKMHKFIEKEIKAQGLDDLIPSHGNILTVLYNHKEPLTMKEIAEKIGKDKSTVTVLINHLLYRGYIKKTIHPLDRRVTLIELTELGLSKEEKYRTISKHVVDTAYKGMSDEEVAQFLSLLKRVSSNFSQYTLYDEVSDANN